MAYKTKVAVGNAVYDMDTIEFEGQLWLVPAWVDSQDGKWTRPVRIINLSKLPHHRFGDGYFLKSPLPASLHAETMEAPQPIPGYEVIELPEIVLPNPTATN
ncbi:hypothetical protein [Neorhizobium petrolearium]|uniref:hypothetical protein n=1 Tax=Neorhizobium petrolearium TaxID=515361 RepID=UPI003F18195B